MSDKRFKIFGISALIIFMAISCDKKFNSDEWKNTNLTSLDNVINKNNNRNLMINDLVESKLLVGKNSKEVKNLLGTPDFKDTLKRTFSYETFEDFGTDIDPKYLKGLDVIFNKDSIVTEAKIYEIKR